MAVICWVTGLGELGLDVCSSGGVPAASVLGSEAALSTVVPDDAGDPAGDVAAFSPGGLDRPPPCCLCRCSL